MAEPPSGEPFAAIKTVFFQECEEQLAALEASLIAIDQGEPDPEVLNGAFRAVHSIKGGASALEFARLAGLAHAIETVLADARTQTMALDEASIRVLLRAADALAELAAEARGGAGAIDETLISSVEADLLALSGDPADGEDDLALLDFVPRPAALASRGDQWVIRFRAYADLYAKANEPLLLLRDLNALGRVETTLDDSALPTLDALDPEEGYLSWTMKLHGSVDAQAIRSVFEFVEGDCDLEISEQAASLAPSPVGSEPTINPSANVAANVAPALTAAPGEAARAPPSRTIRVDVERLDDLANLVGELVINHAMLVQRIGGQQAIGQAAALTLEELDHLTRDLQDCVMAVRAQPLKFVFQRMARVVRDVEAATGKQARLSIEGEDTEVDRTLIEGLADPLTHMIRNAIDHGLETSQERAALGKPTHGTIRISARHRAGRVVIEVEDDGAGINRERVRSIAIERMLIAADAVLSEDEIDQLIFLPGFSTAANVSAVSGRGVGMDVVSCGVQSLGGRISVKSNPGRGTAFTLSLPLTLAVLEGMVLVAQNQTFVAPLATVVEAIPLRQSDLRPVGAGLEVLMLRGAQIPAVDLTEALDLRRLSNSTPPRFALVVEDDAGRRAALLVDDVQGHRQVVIKSLESNFRNIEGVAAATILGDGKVALILDVNAVLAMNRNKAPAPLLVASR
jgi:two-component system chemotaxis sensor kinase CheA